MNCTVAQLLNGQSRQTSNDAAATAGDNERCNIIFQSELIKYERNLSIEKIILTRFERVGINASVEYVSNVNASATDK